MNLEGVFFDNHSNCATDSSLFQLDPFGGNIRDEERGQRKKRKRDTVSALTTTVTQNKNTLERNSEELQQLDKLSETEEEGEISEAFEERVVAVLEKDMSCVVLARVPISSNDTAPLSDSSDVEIVEPAAKREKRVISLEKAERSQDASSEKSFKELIDSIRSLRQEDVIKQVHWMLWSLQENLGDRFPTFLKRISEPSFKNRPLQSLRYMEYPSNDLFYTRDHYMNKEVIEDSKTGCVLIDSVRLNNFRLMFNFYKSNNTHREDQHACPNYCRLCGSTNCKRVMENGTKCLGIRCSRCCLSGHKIFNCYQTHVNDWDRKYMHSLNNVYHESIQNLNQQAMMRCCVCCKKGHAFCQLPATTTSDGTHCSRFKMVTHNDICIQVSLRMRRHPDEIRWDQEVYRANALIPSPPTIRRTNSWFAFNSVNVAKSRNSLAAASKLRKSTA